MPRLTSRLTMLNHTDARRLLCLAALVLPCAFTVSGAEAKSFGVTVTKQGLKPRAMADCTTFGAGVQRLTCRFYSIGSLGRPPCATGRRVYTITLTRRGRPRTGVSCVGAKPRGLRVLRLGERFRSGPFVCRHLSVPSLDQTVPWPRLTGGREGRFRCRRGTGGAGFSLDAYGGTRWPV